MKKQQLALLTLLCISATAAIALPANDGYLFDSRDKVVKSGFDLCWRTTRWTPAMAIEECDADLIKKVEAKPAALPVPVAPTAVAAPKPAAEKMTLSADALFDFDKAVLRPEGKAKLDDLAAKVKDLNLEVIIAVGHADRIGSDAYNQKLSERRATSVKNYLVSKNVEPNRIHTEGKGEKQPVTKPGQCKGKKSKKVIACLQPDRRVEIEVIGTKQPK
jgi:OOP family OmpA-OmpF porin